MLYLVLALVLAAFGLLIAALTTATTLWAWISVAVSVVAAGLLVYDWVRGRRATAAARPPERSRVITAPADDRAEDRVDDDVDDDVVEDDPGDEPAEPVAEESAADGLGEPGEEQTDATDLLVVTEIDAEVRVVDEHPRYHLVSCGWLVDRPTIPIAVSEARQLGFTPCARCGPDARLARQYRAAR